MISRRSCSSERSRQIADAVANWLVSNLRPLSVVSDDGFKDLMRLLEPGYIVPSQTHITSLIKSRFSKCCAELVGLLAREADAVAGTSDAWTSKAIQSYQTHTAHFIDPQWQVVSIVLATSVFSGSPTGEGIAKQICGAVKAVKDTLLSRSMAQ